MVDHLLTEVRPKIFAYLESQADGKFPVGSALSVADIAVVSNLINYLYLGLSTILRNIPGCSAIARQSSGSSRSGKP